MPEVMKTGGAKPPAAAAAKKPVVRPVIPVKGAAVALTLPTTLSVPSADINEYHVCITGEPGIGKTTLGMQQPDVLLLTCDPLAKSLAAYQRHVPDWSAFEQYLKLLEAAAASGKPFPYSRVLIDGVDIWFRRCQDWVCLKLGIEHPADEAWGKGFDRLNQTFSKAVDRLMALPCGIWFICHSRAKEVETRDGSKVEKHSPVLTARAEEVVVGRCNALFNMRYQGDDLRIMRVRANENVVAKCNIDGHFLTAAGTQIQEIVLGNKGADEAYRRLVKAFGNEQTYATYDEWADQRRAAAAKTKAAAGKGAAVAKA